MCLVSICVVTYNQERFIEQALEGIFAQKLPSIDFEILIADDCSTDSTKQIIDAAINKYQNAANIKKMYGSHNIGFARNFLRCISSATGKYIAICEGDDYWTDYEKLRKQIDILERKPEIALSFHRCEQRDATGKLVGLSTRPAASEFDICTLAEANIIPTLSVVFRNSQTAFPEWYYRLSAVDFPLHLTTARRGHVHYSEEVMGVYRTHQGGVWSSKSNVDRLRATIIGLLLPLIDHEFDGGVLVGLRKNLTRHLSEYLSEHTNPGIDTLTFLCDAGLDVQTLLFVIAEFFKEKEERYTQLSKLKSSSWYKAASLAKRLL